MASPCALQTTVSHATGLASVGAHSRFMTHSCLTASVAAVGRRAGAWTRPTWPNPSACGRLRLLNDFVAVGLALPQVAPPASWCRGPPLTIGRLRAPRHGRRAGVWCADSLGWAQYRFQGRVGFRGASSTEWALREHIAATLPQVMSRWDIALPVASTVSGISWENSMGACQEKLGPHRRHCCRDSRLGDPSALSLQLRWRRRRDALCESC